MAVFEKPVMYFDAQGIFKIADGHRQSQVNQAVANKLYQGHPFLGMVPPYGICWLILVGFIMINIICVTGVFERDHHHSFLEGFNNRCQPLPKIQNHLFTTC
jgi:hypothetical protein